MLMKNESGFAMLETLIALLIIMIGVLGIAGIQMLAINNTENGRYQSLASMLASSMVAEMQANILYWGTLPNTTITVIGTTITGGPATYAGTCINTPCTGVAGPNNMASFDLQNWGAAIASGLPSGQGLITCTAANPPYPPQCTLTLIWSEKNIALTNATGTETGQLATGKATTGSVSTGVVTGNNHSYQTTVSIQQ